MYIEDVKKLADFIFSQHINCHRYRQKRCYEKRYGSKSVLWVWKEQVHRDYILENWLINRNMA